MEPLQAASVTDFVHNRAERLGYLLVGHGTRNPVGAGQLLRVHKQFLQLMPGCEAGYCFLELAEPDIPTAIRNLAARGVSRLVTVPLLLFSAGHAQRDIPDAIQDACERFGISMKQQTPALQCCQPILELSACRFLQALSGCRVGPRAFKADYSPLKKPAPMAEDVGLVMVGRGSSSSSATQEMLRFCELRNQLTPVAWRETGFLHAQQPTLETALDGLEASGLPIAVVQPHLLFEGELVEQLRAEVVRRQIRNPGQQWRIAGVLGTDRRLAGALVQFAKNESISESYGVKLGYIEEPR